MRGELPSSSQMPRRESMLAGGGGRRRRRRRRPRPIGSGCARPRRLHAPYGAPATHPPQRQRQARCRQAGLTCCPARHAALDPPAARRRRAQLLQALLRALATRQSGGAAQGERATAHFRARCLPRAASLLMAEIGCRWVLGQCGSAMHSLSEEQLASWTLLREIHALCRPSCCPRLPISSHSSANRRAQLWGPLASRSSQWGGSSH